MAFVRDSISPAWPLGVWLPFGVLAVVHAKRLQRFERARAAERVYLRGLDRLDGRWAGTRPRRRDVSRGPSLRARSRSVRPGLAVRAAEHDAHRDRRADAGRLAARRPRRSAKCARARRRSTSCGRCSTSRRTSRCWRRSRRSAAPDRWRRGPGRRPVRFAPALRAGAGGVRADHDRAGRRWCTAISSRRSGCSPGCSWRPASRRSGGSQFHQVLHAHRHARARSRPARRRCWRASSRERFTSPRLAALHQTLLTDGVPPSTRIAQLRTLVSWLDSTHNMMFAPIAFVLLLRPQLAIAIDRWHAAYGPAVAEWLRARRRGRGAGGAGDLRLRAAGRSVSRAGRGRRRSTRPTGSAIR